jgi:hypothetical protein
LSCGLSIGITLSARAQSGRLPSFTPIHHNPQNSLHNENLLLPDDEKKEIHNEYSTFFHSGTADDFDFD